ncbi:hypothetical protein M601_006490 [Cellulophaga baltica 4]|nr:hypothetical protein M601_006490 [Cellulophaga baltica 4]
MAFLAKLFINGEQRNVLNGNYVYHQLLDARGKPKANVEGGQLNFVVESTGDDALFHLWMLDDYQMYDGYIRFFKRDGLSKLFDFEFANCYCVGLREQFSATGHDPLKMELTITPGIQRVRDVIFEKVWNPSNPFAEAPPVPVEEIPQTKITRISWVNTDEQQEDITEIGATQKASLIVEINNPEGTTVNITIEKEDGTEFESGKTQLSFTESITEDGLVEITPFEIKEQWEEFKTSDIDKLIAKVEHNGKSKQSEVLEIKPKSKVLVNFRPHNGYKGEFGFDWFRVSDTSRQGDVWYKNIVGNYKTGDFIQSDAQYVKLAKQYDQEPHPIKPKDIYLVPIMALYANESAKFSLKVEVEGSDAKKIEYIYDKDLFRLSKPDVSHKTVGKQTLADDVEITCIKEFGTDEYIEVLADGNFAGKLKVLANDKAHRYQANIVFVHVRTEITPTKPRRGVSTGEKTFLTKYLNQALIKPNIIKRDLDLKQDSILNTTYKLNEGGAFQINSKSGLHNHLDNEFNKVHPGFNNYFKVFFFDEEGGEVLVNSLRNPSFYYKGYNGAARSLNSKEVVLFNTHNSSTTTHEILHAMGLAHSFDDAGLFTFKENLTENLMDYSHSVGIERISTWHWQWKTIWPNLIKEMEL